MNMNKICTAILIIASLSFGQNVQLKSTTTSPAGIVTPANSATSLQVKPVVLTPPTSVKSFKEWKNEKVQQAIKKVTITKAQIEYKKLNKQFLQRTEVVSAKDSELDRLEGVLKNDLYSLEVTQELSVTDYFAIYLTKQENKPEAYKEAAQKMTSDEVNQLIKAYADSFFSPGPGSPSATKVGPTAMEKPDLAK